MNPSSIDTLKNNFFEIQNVNSSFNQYYHLCSRSKFLSYFLIFFVKNFHITLFHFTEKRSYFFVVKQRFKE